MKTQNRLQNSPLVPFVDESSMSGFKRAALLFDRLTPAFFTTVPRAKRARFPLSSSFVPRDADRNRLTAELEYLFDRELLNAPSRDPDYTGFELEGFEPDRPVWIIRTPSQMKATQMLKADFTLTDAIRTFSDIGAPVFATEKLLKDETSPASTQLTDVMEVILHHFPIPDDETPWEAIFDWRADDDAQQKRRRLMRWINNVTKDNGVDVRTLEEEILYLIDEYRAAMKVHQFKSRSGLFRTVVTTTAEIIENTAKLKFKDLADLPFRLLGRRIERLEAEQKAAGRELAYIIEANRQFGSK